MQAGRQQQAGDRKTAAGQGSQCQRPRGQRFVGLAGGVLLRQPADCNLLLDKNADVKEADSVGHTPLIGAALKATSTSLVACWKRRGQGSETRSGLTALMQACYSGKVGVARLLIERGADIHART
jgi:ankyrin repeat protein